MYQTFSELVPVMHALGARVSDIINLAAACPDGDAADIVREKFEDNELSNDFREFFLSRLGHTPESYEDDYPLEFEDIMEALGAHPEMQGFILFVEAKVESSWCHVWNIQAYGLTLDIAMQRAVTDVKALREKKGGAK